MLSTGNSFQIQGHIQSVNEGMEKDIPCKQKSKESWRSNTHQIKQTKKTVTRDKGHYTMIKGSIQGDITTINIYVPKIVFALYIQVLLIAIKVEIASNSNSGRF